MNSWKILAVYKKMESKIESDFSFKTWMNIDSYSLKSGKFCSVSLISGKTRIILFIDMIQRRKIQASISASTIIAASQ